MSANLFDRYPWLTRTALLGTALLIVAGLLGADVFREADGAGRYSLIDWLNYRIRCSDGRHIVLRETRPGKVARIGDVDMRIDENGFVRPSKRISLQRSRWPGEFFRECFAAVTEQS